MSNVTQLMNGIVLVTIPTIQFGGYFLLTTLSGQYAGPALTPFQSAFFRAGHAHAGVLVILALVCQGLVDDAGLSQTLGWATRIGIVLAPILVSGGFFASALGSGAVRPSGWIGILYVGIAVLATSVLVLGVGLIRAGWRGMAA